MELGLASDKCITEQCGLLERLIFGDTILFLQIVVLISKTYCWFYCATITMLAFTKAQLSGIDVEQTMWIANIRIHVEHVIGNITCSILRQFYHTN